MGKRIRAMSRAARPQLQAIYEDRSKAIFQLMVLRVSEKRSASGAVTRHGRQIPFTLDEFRTWLLAQFDQRGFEGLARCRYCTTPLNIQTLVIDHAIPVAPPWNGSLDLENLRPSCAQCNRRKGKCSETGWIALSAFLALPVWESGLDPRDVSDVLGRLGTGGEGAKSMWKRKSFARANPAPGGLL